MVKKTTETTTGGTVAPRAQTLRFQGAANRVMRVLLRTPLVCRLIGRWLITVYVVGRKSGTRYILPVAYTRDGDALVIGTPFGWARNLSTGTPVTIRLKGRQREADVQVITDEAGVVDAFRLMAMDNRNFASFNKIGFDSQGRPNADDLHLAWAAGARAIRLTLR
jgi:deazaflavin-dependent oxidoreductase (nitroreductase family)